MHPVRHRLLLTSCFVFAGMLAGVSPRTSAQESNAVNADTAASPSQLAMADALNAMQPLLAQVNTAVSSVDARHWKTPNEVRDTTNSDIQSIQKDLATTLPGMLSQAESTPASIAPAFAVFRNIDALYDVLLRITETATLAGTQSEASRLEGVRSDLQARRAQLGSAILASATAQDNSVVQLRTSLAAASRVAVAPTTPKKVIVDDGPAASKPVRKKKPAAAKPANPSSAPQQ